MTRPTNGRWLCEEVRSPLSVTSVAPGSGVALQCLLARFTRTSSSWMEDGLWEANVHICFIYRAHIKKSQSRASHLPTPHITHISHLTRHHTCARYPLKPDTFSRGAILRPDTCESLMYPNLIQLAGSSWVTSGGGTLLIVPWHKPSSVRRSSD